MRKEEMRMSPAELSASFDARRRPMPREWMSLVAPPDAPHIRPTHHGIPCDRCAYPARMFMVTDEVWAAAGMHRDEYACISCTEVGLGRPLALADFTHCIVNDAIHYGARLALAEKNK